MKGKIVIISGPSGAGEDSIIDGLEKLMPIERVVTTTTRDMRPGEAEAQPYYFISKEDFKNGIEEGKFFEYAEHYNNNFYGVTFEEIERVKNSDKLGIWKIDYKGVMQAKEQMPEVKAIFVNAPMDILEKRIRSRGGVTEEYVKERMAYTREWLEHTDIYDYAIENTEGDLEGTIMKVKDIIDSI